MNKIVQDLHKELYDNGIANLACNNMDLGVLNKMEHHHPFFPNFIRVGFAGEVTRIMIRIPLYTETTDIEDFITS